MGVPSFFRWLEKKYPKIIDACQGSNKTDHTDLDSPNLNGFEIDNFYLDMNGLIHPCFHPQDRPAPDTIDDMLIMLKRYLDYIIDIVRPRKLVYMAVDGVAPRAKMNQQRARRFKAARDAQSKEEYDEQKNITLIQQGHSPIAIKPTLDSNCITPGTVFMERVTETLKEYVKERISTSAYWKKLVVIISDASVPGEGEHKIMEYIRKQKDQPNYNPNIHHCIYGLDADLIMLTLATHERKFSIIREQVFFEHVPCYICGQQGHAPDRCSHKGEIGAMDPIRKPFLFLHCHILREYLSKTIRIEGFDFERIIDDFIFFCFFVGNDFLPHSPSLEIREGSIDMLMEVYMKFLPENGYLTDSGTLNATHAKNFMSLVGQREQRILQSKSEKESRFRINRKGKMIREFDDKISAVLGSGEDQAIKDLKLKHLKLDKENFLKGIEKEESEDINYSMNGYQAKYYASKLKIEYPSEAMTQLVNEYFIGLSWVLKYYYQGCQCWDWYFPYLYAPFIADVATYLDNTLEPKFELGIPFKPVEQLMSVLPPRSKECVPMLFRDIMNSTTSPIKEFYPEKFAIDMNGKTQEYLAVILLSFIDQNKLLEVLKPLEKQLQGQEFKRNMRWGESLIFFSKENPKFAEAINSFTGSVKSMWDIIKDTISEIRGEDEKVDLSRYGETAYELKNDVNGVSGVLLPSEEMCLCQNGENVFVCAYSNPIYDPNHLFISKYLDGETIQIPEKVLDDINKRNRHYQVDEYIPKRREPYYRGARESSYRDRGYQNTTNRHNYYQQPQQQIPPQQIPLPPQQQIPPQQNVPEPSLETFGSVQENVMDFAENPYNQWTAPRQIGHYTPPQYQNAKMNDHKQQQMIYDTRPVDQKSSGAASGYYKY
ncbi:5'-_3' exoribonuclease, putative [Entamoeba invadens IP1]|uniref:5'-3' exoribonuclease n=1 Tax=Entamoeba invadens IP1 TaxID=370355 RepID=A0A0A1U3U9_ENTIV|nr:5'->3' exoribonuclease, putative [Entamoeba invadens IP1]ELP86279.1 5'->3' exoribonuclease, putative [Entamoeba invadens IP1]|eukprot:XP_004185625.1 5'-_3' exoribonuclease, putative [Entamoeba invadens IP1]